LLAEVRIDQSTRALDGLSARISLWRAGWDRADALQQYRTQLRVLEATLTGALVRLRHDLEGAAATPVGRTFALCRAADRRVELVRRVFDYYRTKFDQRDDPELGPVLRAADEVVWSCWAPPFRTLEDEHAGVARPPSPLPYIEPEYSPRAIPRDDPPPDLSPEADSVLVAFLGKLPVPVISLPPLCVTDPWWLILVAHEVGHHLQFDLCGGWTLVGTFGDIVESASAAAGAPEPGSWRNWSQEIFADLCSVYAVGPAAIRGIVQLELDDEERMLRSTRAKYPPPLVRIALLALAADRAGVRGREALDPLRIDGHGMPGPWGDYLRLQLKVAAEVLASLASTAVPAIGSLDRLFEWSPAAHLPGGRVSALRDGLLGRAPLHVQRSAVSPRLTTAAAVAAWDHVAGIPQPKDREEERAKLAERVPAAIVAGREEGTRAAERTAPIAVDRLVEDLSSLLSESFPLHEES
jgi:hypothetical protein